MYNKNFSVFTLINSVIFFIVSLFVFFESGFSQHILRTDDYLILNNVEYSADIKEGLNDYIAYSDDLATLFVIDKDSKLAYLYDSNLFLYKSFTLYDTDGTSFGKQPKEEEYLLNKNTNVYYHMMEEDAGIKDHNIIGFCNLDSSVFEGVERVYHLIAASDEFNSDIIFLEPTKEQKKYLRNDSIFKDLTFSTFDKNNVNLKSDYPLSMHTIILFIGLFFIWGICTLVAFIYIKEKSSDVKVLQFFVKKEKIIKYTLNSTVNKFALLLTLILSVVMLYITNWKYMLLYLGMTLLLSVVCTIVSTWYVFKEGSV